MSHKIAVFVIALIREKFAGCTDTPLIQRECSSILKQARSILLNFIGLNQCQSRCPVIRIQRLFLGDGGQNPAVHITQGFIKDAFYKVPILVKLLKHKVAVLVISLQLNGFARSSQLPVLKRFRPPLNHFLVPVQKQFPCLFHHGPARLVVTVNSFYIVKSNDCTRLIPPRLRPNCPYQIPIRIKLLLQDLLLIQKNSLTAQILP